MLTKVEVRVFDRLLKLATRFPILPLDWNPESGQLTVPESKLKYCVALITHSLSLCNFVFVICRFIPGFPYDYENTEEGFVSPFTLHLYLTLRSLIIDIGQHFLLNDAKIYCAWFQRLRKFNVNYGMKKLKKQYANPTWRDTYLKYFERFVCIPIFLSCLVFPVLRENPNYVFSVLPEDWKTWWWVVAIATIYETHTVLRVSLFFFLLCSFTYSQVYSIHFWIKQCRKWVAVGKLKQVFMTTKMLEILIRAWDTHGIYEICKVQFELAVVISIYMSIRLYKFLGVVLLLVPVLVIIIGFIVDAVFTSTTADVYEKSVELKSQLTSKIVTMEPSEMAYTIRMIRSYRPGRIQNPLFYYQRKGKLLTLELYLTVVNYLLVSF